MHYVSHQFVSELDTENTNVHLFVCVEANELYNDITYYRSGDPPGPFRCRVDAIILYLGINSLMVDKGTVGRYCDAKNLCKLLMYILSVSLFHITHTRICVSENRRMRIL